MSYEEIGSGEITSLISVPVTNCNVPDPKSIGTEFVYNFYVDGEDRQYNTDPMSPISSDMGLVDRETIERIEARERGSLSARVPRYIRISISPYLNEIEPLSEGEVSNDILEALRRSSGGSRAYSPESEIENAYGARLTTIDSGAKNRVQSEIYRIAESLIEACRQSNEYSDQTVAMTLNSILSDDIDASILMDALSDNQLKGYQFVNQISGKRYSRFDLRESVSVLSKVNADGYRRVTSQQVISNPLSSNFLVDLLGSSADPGERNWVLDGSIFGAFNGFSDADLESLQPNLRALDVSEELFADSREALVSLGYPTIKHAGYIVEKLATSPEGEQERFPDLIVLNPSVTEFIDPVVKYGFTYTYRARQLFIVKTLQVESLSESGSDYRYRIVTSGIASSSPTPATVRAIETTPPNPPGTLICSFIYKSGNGIRLDWARPSNPTRDIRKYQVFRRRGFLDPYQLIAEYDFTDPLYTQFDQRESIDPALVVKTPAPIYSHIDREFGRESSYMYCVASVDAHGLTSAYGTQVQAKFDRFSNSLTVKTVSQSGAPKAYPNYFVDPTELEEFGSDRLVEDVIKDSGHGRMRLYFNPDTYRVASDEDGTETQPIVLSSDRGIYKFQIINLDRQVPKTLSISVNKDSSLGDVI